MKGACRVKCNCGPVPGNSHQYSFCIAVQSSCTVQKIQATITCIFMSDQQFSIQQLYLICLVYDRTALSKIFGKKSKPESPQPPSEPEKKVETTSQQVGDWEVLESNPPSDQPPAVKEKPSPAVREKPAVKPKHRPQPSEPDSTPAPAEQVPAKKVPIGVAMPNMNMDELTSALGRKKPKVICYIS